MSKLDKIRELYPIKLRNRVFKCSKCGKEHEFEILAKNVEVVKENFIDDKTLKFNFLERVACCVESDSCFTSIAATTEGNERSYDYLAVENSNNYRMAQKEALDKLASEGTIYYIFRHYHTATHAVMTNHVQIGMTMDKDKIWDIIKEDEEKLIKQANADIEDYEQKLAEEEAKKEELNKLDPNEKTMIDMLHPEFRRPLHKPVKQIYTYSISIGFTKETPGLVY